MDFQAQANVICRAFLYASVNQCRGQPYKLFDSEFLSPTVLSSILDGDKIVKSLLNLTNDFDNRFNNSFDLESVVQHLVPDTHESVDLILLIESYLEVLDGLFDKQNWGRIIAMFAFLRMLVFKMIKIEHDSAIMMLIEITGKYCEDKLQTWINDHDGWSGIIGFSEQSLSVDKYESLWKTLRSVGGLATGAVGALGIAALVGFIANKI